MMAEENAFTIEVKYHENLKILDESKPIGISFVNKYSGGEYKNNNIHQYAKFLPINENGDLVEIVEGKTLRFKFMPSLMYEHNALLYSFVFTNVGSAEIYYLKDGSEYCTEPPPQARSIQFPKVLHCLQ